MLGAAPRRTDFWRNHWRNGNIEVAKHLLSAREVQTAGVGELRDGAALILRVKAKSASWISGSPHRAAGGATSASVRLTAQAWKRPARH
jgi:hypothetical protein